MIAVSVATSREQLKNLKCLSFTLSPSCNISYTFIHRPQIFKKQLYIKILTISITCWNCDRFWCNFDHYVWLLFANSLRNGFSTFKKRKHVAHYAWRLAPQLGMWNTCCCLHCISELNWQFSTYSRCHIRLDLWCFPSFLYIL